jgi:putative transcriptional regulator
MVRHWRTLRCVEFIRLPTFERISAGIFSEMDILDLEVSLILHPDAGELIPGGRGLRKLRRPGQIRIPMKEADFQILLQGIREAGACLRGDKKAAARIDRIDPESVIAIRSSLKLSQQAFASAFGISLATLRNWEQGRRQPSGAARVLLRVAARHPKAVLEAVR